MATVNTMINSPIPEVNTGATSYTNTTGKYLLFNVVAQTTASPITSDPFNYIRIDLDSGGGGTARSMQQQQVDTAFNTGGFNAIVYATMTFVLVPGQTFTLVSNKNFSITSSIGFSLTPSF